MIAEGPTWLIVLIGALATFLRRRHQRNREGNVDGSLRVIRRPDSLDVHFKLHQYLVQ